MMEHYTVGSDAKALDSFGVWHHCTVKSIEEVGVKVYFTGWPNKLDRTIQNLQSIRRVCEVQ